MICEGHHVISILMYYNQIMEETSIFMEETQFPEEFPYAIFGES